MTARRAALRGVAVGTGVGVGGGGVGVGAAPRVTVRLADRLTSNKAVIVTALFVETAKVVTVKFAEVCPAGTNTMPGAVATKRLLVESVTLIPPEGAGALRKTVLVALLPPVTLAGLMVTDCNNGGAFGSGATLTKIDFVTPPAVAFTCAPPGTWTRPVVIAKLFVLLPSAMLTVAGTCTTPGLSLVRLTTPPPVGAGITRPTLARPEFPPMRSWLAGPIASKVGAPGAGSTSSTRACCPLVVP